jgi:glycosyltransferase involved in cell wall biosynthesis
MPYVAGDSAVFVNPFSEDSIREGLFKIRKSESLRSKLIYNGFKNAKRFLIKNIAAEHLKVYFK